MEQDIDQMRIHVIGTRGFPRIQGGVEKHCESLYPILASMGCEIRVCRRKPYIDKSNGMAKFEGVHFTDVYSPGHRNFETIVHSLICAIICLREKPDIVHIHNIGPSLVLPILKIGRLKTIVTYHSANYEHEKWGFFAKKVLKTGEKFVGKLADMAIFVSKTAFRSVECGNKIHIPNGVQMEKHPSNTEFLARTGLSPGGYILAVGRFAPEKGILDLIKAFKDSDINYKLVIAGDADHETEYSRIVRKEAKEDNRIILTGYVAGDPLSQLYANARLFVLPSHNEGFPIALLEAMSYGLPVLASDIPATGEVELPAEQYFSCRDIGDLKDKLENLLNIRPTAEERENTIKRVAENYDWEKIAEQTLKVYENILAEKQTS